MTDELKPNTVTLKKEKFDMGTGHVIDVTEVTLTSANKEIESLSELALQRFREINK